MNSNFGLIHDPPDSLDGRHERFGFAINVTQVIDGSFDVRNVNIQWLYCPIGAEVDGPILDNGAVDREGEQVPDHLQPGPAHPRLSLVLARGIHEVEFGLLHHHAPDDLAVKQRIPLDGEIDSLCRKQRNGYIAGDLADADVLDGIGASPQVKLDFAQFASVPGTTLQRPVYVVADNAGQHRASHADDSERQEEDESNSPPPPGSVATIWTTFGPFRGPRLRGLMCARIVFHNL